MRLLWLTDILLNFVTEQQIRGFLRSLLEEAPDAIFVGGDIGEAPTVVRYLRQMEEELRQPIYFVLGNHDFYRGSIVHVRDEVCRLTGQSNLLSWLNLAGVVSLTPTTALIGHDGWGDGRLGNYSRSTVDLELNDFELINELRGLGKEQRLQRIESLGREASEHFNKNLAFALHNHRHVFVLTHVPPFKEASWYNGRPCDDDWLPFFACKAAGDTLVEIMKKHPDKQLTVLCGHTHGSGTVNILPNLFAVTGGAEYGRPQAQQVFEID